jgi:hypothetical protein
MPVFGSLINSRKAPALGSTEHAIITAFISIQYGRAETREAELIAMVDNISKQMIRYSNPTLSANIDKYMISWTNVASI